MEQKTSEIWQNAQEWEQNWHGNCINSINEEIKQLVYAEKMGLVRTPTPKTPYNFDLQGKSILDIGGGAYSLLLKCTNFAPYIPHADKATGVIDPLMDQYPKWVRDRYLTMGIAYMQTTGEDARKSLGPDSIFDEVWLYNVLEHTYNPKKIIQNALALGKIVRIFEWLDTVENIGHPQVLTGDKLNEWLKGTGKVEFINQNGAVGKAYYGIFPTPLYTP